MEISKKLGLDNIDLEEMIYQDKGNEAAKLFLQKWLIYQSQNGPIDDVSLVDLLHQAIEWAFEEGVISER